MYKITSKEVSESLDNFEWITLKDTGVKNLSGGFAEADIFDKDEDYFDIELRWGCKSDSENKTHIEYYKMDRKTLEIKNA